MGENDMQNGLADMLESISQLKEQVAESAHRQAVAAEQDSKLGETKHQIHEDTQVLPPGWQKHYNDEHKKRYYYNKELGKTSWSVPSADDDLGSNASDEGWPEQSGASSRPRISNARPGKAGKKVRPTGGLFRVKQGTAVDVTGQRTGLSTPTSAATGSPTSDTN